MQTLDEMLVERDILTGKILRTISDMRADEEVKETAKKLFSYFPDCNGFVLMAAYKGERGERFSGRGRFDGKKLKVRKRGGKEHPDDDMVRLFINIGKKQHVKPGDILGAIAGEAGISGRLVGAIDLCESFSFVDVDRKNADKVMRAMKNVKIRGLNVHMEKANGEK